MKVYPEKGITTASLPFVVADPDSLIAPNEFDALKVYRSQVKKLNLSPNNKVPVLESEKKLQELGFVDYIDN